ncbi:MAG: lytic murein transglycosylase B, partial [Gallionellaceae bacterium]
VFFVFFMSSTSATATEFTGLPLFIDEMVSEHQFNRAKLERLFSHVKRKQSIIDAISRPAKHKPWPEYRAAFVNAQGVNAGLKFWRLNATTLKRAEKQFGVPAEIIVALLGVETRYGYNTGKYRTLDALSTLAFDYPRRAKFFRDELKQYLLLAREKNFNVLKVKSSYAGALGIPQFMPSSYRNYAVDFSGDGKTDLLHDPVDAIGSVANYLKQYGWLRGEPITTRVSPRNADTVVMQEIHSVDEWKTLGVTPKKTFSPSIKARLIDYTFSDGKEYWLGFTNFDVITLYNHSDYYAMSIFQLAQKLRQKRN